jgi:hypothetical protein
MFFSPRGFVEILIATITASNMWAQSPVAESVQATVRIRVTEGDGAINSIRLRRAREPVVQVLDQRGEPIPGATVSFVLPGTGPSGTFGASGLSLTTQTDQRGMAVGRSLRPNQIAGQFRIRATASWRGAAAATTLVQTNAEPVAVSSSKKIAILALIGAGVAGGILAAVLGGGAGATGPAGAAATPPPPVPAGSIAAGTPSLGPPK